MPTIVVQCLIHECLTTAFPDDLRVFTDGSVSTHTKTATVAYVIPAFKVGHASRLHVFASKIVTKLVLIRIHLITFTRWINFPQWYFQRTHVVLAII